MQFAAFYSSLSRNLGDAIQTLAGSRFLPHVDNFIDRDDLQNYADIPRTFYIGNGWYSNDISCFPPPNNLLPFYIGFHWSPMFPASTAVFAHLKKYEPIGARDDYTLIWLRQHGVDSYLSGCITLTLERPNLPRTDEILLVDVYPEYMGYIPRQLLRNAVRWSHYCDPKKPEQILESAGPNLRAYASAKLVITGRLHVALPCLAYGTPVILLANVTDPRFAGACPGWRPQILGKYIDWNPEPPDIDGPKQDLIRRCLTAVENVRAEDRTEFS
jgi:hypothetical protein